MSSSDGKYVKWNNVIYFFPFQLLLVQLKKNQVLLLFWIILFGFISQNIAPRYGVPYLFLGPEYLGKIGFLSYFITGFSCGGFIIAYNISSFIINAFRFPFLATCSNTFFKFSLNNFIIPFCFVVYYSFEIFYFQYKQQWLSVAEIWICILGLWAGIVSFCIFSFTYFFSFDKDIFKMFGIKTADNDELPKSKIVRITLKRNKDWKRLSGTESRDWHVETYISNFTRIRRARDISHYDKEMLKKVFRNNHYTAAFFEVFVITTLLILGLFIDKEIFLIPASASVFLVFTLYLMLFSALHSWLRGWSTTVMIIVLIIFNSVYALPFLYPASKAIGLKYDKKVKFNYENLLKYNSHEDTLNKDFENTLYTLNKWRLKNSINTMKKGKKPKIIFINTTGGGLRSALWTFNVLQNTDSVMNGDLMKHSFLITGASGGMIGAAFYRELYYLYQKNKLENYFISDFRENISKDMLNPIVFSIATNDLFLRLGRYEDNGQIYLKDRGYAFEKVLNDNTAGILDKRLKDYFTPERESHIPTMIFAPTLVNDGRKMYISSQGTSYLTKYFDSDSLHRKASVDGIEYKRFFAEQSAMDTRFSSVLRMSATFPYVTPFVELPSEPVIEVMDAGARDNYGLGTSLKFLYTFRNWISSNTSGVVIIQIRDRFKQAPVEGEGAKSLMNSVSSPVNSFYGNLFSIQDYNNDALYQYASRWFDGQIDVVEFQLKNEKTDNISLSWHLTKTEKQKIIKSIKEEENKAALKKLISLLK